MIVSLGNGIQWYYCIINDHVEIFSNYIEGYSESPGPLQLLVLDRILSSQELLSRPCERDPTTNSR